MLSPIHETTSPPGGERRPVAIETETPRSAYAGIYWRSALDKYWTITQTNALMDYHLRPKDIEELKFEKAYVMRGTERHWYYKYKEKEVLQEAWRRYGGPDGFWNFLKGRRNAVLNNPTKLANFDERLLFDYSPGRFYDITKDFFTPAPNHPYHRLPQAARSIYDKLGLRVYLACTEALENAEWPPSPGDTYTEEVAEDGSVTSHRVPPSLARNPAAVAALETAVAFFAAYPARPAKPLKSTSRPTTRAINEVRAVLNQAPRAPRRRTEEWGSEAEKLEFVDEPSPSHYEWDTEYLERVFAKLCALIERDPSTWEGIRWDVYDAYLKSVSLRTALRYDALQLLWSDSAAEWLARRLPPDALWEGLRGKCASGQRYDELLGEPLPPKV